MCKLHPRTSRLGSSLAHGKAHEADHQAWSRRDFLVRMGAGGAAASFMIGNTPMTAYANHSMFQSLRDIETDRVLVLIQLTGGNDGLNTIVPISNDIYYQNRPSISISSNDAIALNNDFGLHPELAGFEAAWGDGNLGIIHGVGYPDPTLSHFRSTDIWATGSGADDFLNTGWIGRALGETHPDYSLNPPDYPLVVQLGNAASVLMQGPVGPMGMNILSDSIFERLANGGNIYDEDNVPSNTYGQELAFARTISNDSYEYAAVISDAMDGVSNSVDYPNNNELADSISQVARMIKGGLPTHIYLVNLGGFDTHTNQETRHGQLMEKLGGAMTAFYDDLQASGDADRVMMMTFSEFGRRIGENSSNGTDHGAAAPVIIMGNGVAGGFYGAEEDLSNTTGGGNVVHTTDFRKVYSSVLRNWLEIDEQLVTNVFGGNFGAFAFIEGSTGDDGDPDAGDGGGGDNGDGGGGDNGDGGDGGDGGGGDNGDGGDGGGGDNGDGGDGGGGDNGDGGDGGDGGGGDNGDGGDGGDGGGGDNGDGGTSTGVGDENVLGFTLDQNYPNPFRGRTQIQFELPQTMRADITVYDMAGRQIKVLAKGTMDAGKHSVTFNAGNLASGVYMCRLTTPLGTVVRRMTVLR